MATQTDNRQPKTMQGEQIALMYPGNRLKKQVRRYGETPSTLQVVKDAFFKA